MRHHKRQAKRRRRRPPPLLFGVIMVNITAIIILPRPRGNINVFLQWHRRLHRLPLRRLPRFRYRRSPNARRRRIRIIVATTTVIADPRRPHRGRPLPRLARPRSRRPRRSLPPSHNGKGAMKVCHTPHRILCMAACPRRPTRILHQRFPLPPFHKAPHHRGNPHEEARQAPGKEHGDIIMSPPPPQGRRSPFHRIPHPRLAPLLRRRRSHLIAWPPRRHRSATPALLLLTPPPPRSRCLLLCHPPVIIPIPILLVIGRIIARHDIIIIDDIGVPVGVVVSVVVQV